MTQTNRRSRLTIAVTIALLGLATAPGAARGDHHEAPKFKKFKLSDKFYSEGAAAGDINKDGTLDFVAGPFWYAGPDYQKKHEYYAPVEVDPKGYSANFFAYTDDF